MTSSARQVPRSPATGGAGQIVRLEGTGWSTLDAKAAWRGAGDIHTLGFGAHWDVYAVDSNRYATADWAYGPQGALNLASRGRTRTAALWAQDAIRLDPAPDADARRPLRMVARRSRVQFFSAAPALSVDQART
ncbi:MAG: hypothetical protein WDN44_06275 [Sphingomonas sp.]